LAAALPNRNSIPGQPSYRFAIGKRLFSEVGVTLRARPRLFMSRPARTNVVETLMPTISS
jgi:hypothetical protein